jgi:archaellum component FlaC
MLNMREAWTDERLDDFATNVDKRFDQVDKRFEQVDKRFEQVDKRFDQVDKRFDQVDRRFDRLEDKFEDLNKTLLWFGGGAMITFIVGFAGLIVTQL